MDTDRRIERVWRWHKRRASQSTRDALVEHYLPVVQAEAHRLLRKLPASVTAGELVSDGTLGLFDAIEQYRPGESKFETFGRRRILGAMLDGLRSRDVVSRSARVTARKLDAAADALRSETGAEPTPQQVAEHLNMPLDAYLRKQRQARHGHVRSLNEPPHPGGASGSSRHGRNAAERPVDAAAAGRHIDPRARLVRESVKELIGKGLSRAERLVILLYYYESMSMKEIGRVLDLSEARVSQMHTSVLARLRAQLNVDELRG